MKTTLKSFLTALGVVLLASSTAQAGTLYWQGSNNSTWSVNSTDTNWNATDGGGATTAWTAGESAVFNSNSTYTVNLFTPSTTNVSANSITINAGNVTFNPYTGGRGIDGLTGLTVNSGAGATAFLGTNVANNVLKLANNSVITNNGSGNLTIWSITRTTGNTNLSFDGAGNITVSNFGSFGTGTITKNGAGTLTIGSRGTNATAQLVSINGGTLFFNSVGNGTAGLTTSNATNALTLSNNATFRTVTRTNLSGNSTAIGGIRLSNTAGGTLQVEGSDVFTMEGVISETSAGSQLTKTGTGTVKLSAANTYTGLTTVSAGTLEYAIANAISTGNVTVNGASAVLDLKTFSDSVGTVTLDGGGQINSSSGVLTSNGTFEMKSGSASAILAGSVALNKTTGGTVTLNGTNTYSGATTVVAGTLLISGTGSINNTSAITVNNGATFRYNSSTALTQSLTLDSGSTLAGSGNLGTVALTIGSGVTLSPGNSPGSQSTGAQTWLNGGNYNWQLLDATGAAGTGYDTISITGGLNLTNLTGSPDFNINLWTLASIGPDVNGNASNFNMANNYSWTLVSTTGGITGFNALNFTINTAAANGTGGFSNAFNGSFSVSVSGNNLMLNYIAVPEPSTWGLLAGSLTFVMILRRRHRQS